MLSAMREFCSTSSTETPSSRLMATIERAMSIYRSLGMKPLHVRKEIDAFIADRLLDETAAWIWIGGRIPADDGSPRRNQPLLHAIPDLADRLEG